MVQLQTGRLLRHLTSPFDPDAYLSVLNPRWGTRLRGVIEAVTPQHDTAATLTIRPGVTWGGHRPGQFVTLGVDVDGIRHHRCYSISSTPRDRAGRRSGTIEITVQATEGGMVSNHLVHRARVGDVVQLSQAEGEFTFERTGRPGTPRASTTANGEGLLFLTGGSGITPVMSMLRWLDGQRPGTDAVVLHHATNPERCLFIDELAELDRVNDWLRVETTYTRIGTGSAPRLTAERLDELCPDWRSRRSYACGPEPLLDFALEQWSAAGITDLLRTERFVPPSRLPARPSGSDVASIARFAAAGVDVTADAHTPLLELAESAGLTPPSGCRMGVCHTCSTRLEEGCVRDLRDGRLKEAGQHVQICVSAAAGDVVLDL